MLLKNLAISFKSAINPMKITMVMGEVSLFLWFFRWFSYRIIPGHREASEASEAAVPEAWSCSESYSLVEWLFHGDFLPESPRFSGLM